MTGSSYMTLTGGVPGGSISGEFARDRILFLVSRDGKLSLVQRPVFGDLVYCVFTRVRFYTYGIALHGAAHIDGGSKRGWLKIGSNISAGSIKLRVSHLPRMSLIMLVAPIVALLSIIAVSFFSILSARSAESDGVQSDVVTDVAIQKSIVDEVVSYLQSGRTSDARLATIDGLKLFPYDAKLNELLAEIESGVERDNRSLSDAKVGGADVNRADELFRKGMGCYAARDFRCTKLALKESKAIVDSISIKPTYVSELDLALKRAMHEEELIIEGMVGRALSLVDESAKLEASMAIDRLSEAKLILDGALKIEPDSQVALSTRNRMIDVARAQIVKRIAVAVEIEHISGCAPAAPVYRAIVDAASRLSVDISADLRPSTAECREMVK